MENESSFYKLLSSIRKKMKLFTFIFRKRFSNDAANYRIGNIYSSCFFAVSLLKMAPHCCFLLYTCNIEPLKAYRNQMEMMRNEKRGFI